MSELKIMTLNVKNASITSSFAKRAISIQELVRWHDPDIIGTQELIDPMIDYLPELTETYTFYGKARGSAGKRPIIITEPPCPCRRFMLYFMHS